MVASEAMKFSQNHRAFVRDVSQVVITGLILWRCLPPALQPGIDNKFAVGIVGTVVGFWFSGRR